MHGFFSAAVNATALPLAAATVATITYRFHNFLASKQKFRRPQQVSWLVVPVRSGVPFRRSVPVPVLLNRNVRSGAGTPEPQK